MSRESKDEHDRSGLDESTYAIVFEASESVEVICWSLEALPKECLNVDIADFDTLFAGRTTIEAVQIQLALYQTNLARKVNGMHQALFIPSHQMVDGAEDRGSCIPYNEPILTAMQAKQNQRRCTNGLITEAIDYFALHDLASSGEIDTSRGSCFGLTILAVSAFLTGNMSAYIERTHAIVCMDPEQFPAFLASLKNAIDRYQLMLKDMKTGDALSIACQQRVTELREFHTDIQAFLYAVELYQRPHKYADLLGRADAAHELSQDILHAGSYVEPIDVPKEFLPAEVAIFQDAYTREILSDELGLLVDQLMSPIGHADRFSLSFNVFGHRMALHYDASNQQWFLQNPNYLPGELFNNDAQGRASLANRIFDQQSQSAESAILFFGFRIFAQSRHLDELKARFEKARYALAEYRKVTAGALEVRNEEDGNGRTLLEFSEKYDFLDETIIKLLRVNPVFRDYVFSDTKTMLMRCISAGNLHSVERLIELGADVTVEDRNGWTALDYAICFGNEEQVKQLILMGDINRPIRGISEALTPLMYACEQGYVEEVKALLVMRARVDCVDSAGYRAFNWAMVSRNPEIMDALLLAPQSLNSLVTKEGATPLVVAIEFDRPDLVRKLLDAGADLDCVASGGYGVLALAKSYGQSAIASLLEAEMLKRNRLLMACEIGDVIKVGVFIGEGDDVHRKNSLGMTALDIACEKGFLDVVDELVKGGANIEVLRPGDDFRPIHIACQTRNLNLYKYLLRAGANRHMKVGVKTDSSILRPYPQDAKAFQHAKRTILPTVTAKPVPPPGGSPGPSRYRFVGGRILSNGAGLDRVASRNKPGSGLKR